MTTGLVHNNVQLRIDQFAAAANPQRALEIARWLIAGKIRNARTMLRRHLAGSAADVSEDSGADVLDASLASEPMQVAESVMPPHSEASPESRFAPRNVHPPSALADPTATSPAESPIAPRNVPPALSPAADLKPALEVTSRKRILESLGE